MKRISKSGRIYYTNYKKTGKPRGPIPREKVNYNRNVDICLIRDNFTCQYCGSKKSLDVHHKDNGGHHLRKYETNDDPNNLITLCHKCHLRLHYNTLKRNNDIANMRDKGNTLQSIANKYKLSRQRVFQIINA